MKIAIIGGGPIGVEAALYAAQIGFEPQLFELGRIGEAARRWGHVQMFTEWARNRSPLGERLLRERGDNLPDASEFPSGNDLADYLLRLVSLPQLKGRVLPQTRVLSLTRDGLNKSDFYGDPRRHSRPFRVLSKGVAGEKTRFFDAVLDCSGVYASPNNLGTGGARCAGETGLAPFIDYAIPDVLGAERGRFVSHHTLVVGSGHSAAQTAISVAKLMESAPKTRLTWGVRRDLAFDGSLYALDPNDISSGRRKLGETANALAKGGKIELKIKTQISAVARKNGRFQVRFSDETEAEFDNICAHTGFRPDLELWRELQIAAHPATDGPSRLASAILGANRAAGVGISTGYAQKLGDIEKPEASENSDTRELLRLDEPNFHVLGIKSYGRDAGFLIGNGFHQIRDVFQILSGNEALDLYR